MVCYQCLETRAREGETGRGRKTGKERDGGEFCLFLCGDSWVGTGNETMKKEAVNQSWGCVTPAVSVAHAASNCQAAGWMSHPGHCRSMYLPRGNSYVMQRRTAKITVVRPQPSSVTCSRQCYQTEMCVWLILGLTISQARHLSCISMWLEAWIIQRLRLSHLWPVLLQSNLVEKNLFAAAARGKSCKWHDHTYGT